MFNSLPSVPKSDRKGEDTSSAEDSSDSQSAPRSRRRAGLGEGSLEKNGMIKDAGVGARAEEGRVVEKPLAFKQPPAEPSSPLREEAGASEKKKCSQIERGDVDSHG